MTQYRKKPVVIEAVQYTGGTMSVEDVPAWLVNAMFNRIVRAPDDEKTKELYVHTLEGVMTVSKGDWIIQGVKGEIYPCKPNIFAATYDLVTPTTNKDGEAE